MSQYLQTPVGHDANFIRICKRVWEEAGGDGGPEGEIALIFAAEIELLLGSFAAAPPPERLSGYLICIGIPSSSAALATAFPVSTRKEG